MQTLANHRLHQLLKLAPKHPTPAGWFWVGYIALLAWVLS